MKPIRTELLIIGGGVVGAAIARALSRYQLQVALVEKEVDVAFGASKANSGIVHSGIHDRPGSLKAQLCVRGNQLFPQLVEELAVLYKKNGQLIVARNAEELPLLDELLAQGRTNGVTGIAWVNQEDLHKLEPNLAPSLCRGLLVEAAGIVVPFDLVQALMENAVANGVQLKLGRRVVKIEVVNDEFIVYTNHEPIIAKAVINAAGLGAGEVAALIGDDSIQIQPRQGEEYILDRQLEGLVLRTIFPLPTSTSKGILIIPTVEGNIMLAPTAHSVDFTTDRGTSLRGWQEVYQMAQVLVPGVPDNAVIASFAGVRASVPANDFIIGPSPVSPGFINVAGIDSPGLTAAPAIAEYVVALLKEAGRLGKEKRDFNPRRTVLRPSRLNLQAWNGLIRNEPAYGQLVCRCEQISAAEIKAAIKRGATTLDGIKLRTRAGMGRCQGGFCSPHLIMLLSSELGLPPWQITKNGPGSELLAGPLRGKTVANLEEGGHEEKCVDPESI
jgi:glycerol-3-phosphate dehydrogenase